MKKLDEIYPHLSFFSDIDWASVTAEHEASYKDLSFPEYLQQKAIEGDCPVYLFEIAYYEHVLHDLKSIISVQEHRKGIHLNPTAHFLNLEFDVERMLEDAKKSQLNIYEKTHVLCLYKNSKGKICTLNLSQNALEILQELEDGPQKDRSFLTPSQKKAFEDLLAKDVLFEV